jgi:AcrR family transcriptional regulator
MTRFAGGDDVTPTPGKRTKAAEKQSPGKRGTTSVRRERTERAAATVRSRSVRKQSTASPAPPRTTGKRTGRRPGVSGSRQAIIDAARAKFAERGYEGATIRSIAHDAGVDAALIHHFFETKEGVFSAAMRDAFDVDGLIGGVVEPGVNGLGERIVRMFLGMWDASPSRDAMLGMIRSSVSHPDAAKLLRGVLGTDLVGRITKEAGLPDAELRAALIGSQLVGLAMTRYVVEVPTLLSLGNESMVHAIAPTVQRYLVDAVPEVKTSRRRPRRAS